jgi:superfamily I DNA and RNA helicase
LVYVYGFEESGGGLQGFDVIRKRNLAFTAMTRTKGWLMLTGVGQISHELFREIQASLEQIGVVSFVAPDMKTIQRNLETYENQRRRQRIRSAEKSIASTIKRLADVDPEDLSPELRRQLYRLLFEDKED